MSFIPEFILFHSRWLTLSVLSIVKIGVHVHCAAQNAPNNGMADEWKYIYSNVGFKVHSASSHIEYGHSFGIIRLIITNSGIHSLYLVFAYFSPGTFSSNSFV